MIYLDNSATTKPLQEVMNTFIQVNEQYYANPSSIHEAGVTANLLLTKAREQIAGLIGAEPERVIFTASGTEANNFAVYSVSKTQTHIGKHILTTNIEHASVLEAVNRLKAEGYDVEYLKVNEQGVVTIEELAKRLRKDTILVSMMHVNNEMGAVQPIKEVAQYIHEHSRAIFHVDAVQSFGKMPIRFDDENGPDMISVSGHKINGLKGSGFFAFRKKYTIEPFIVGGGQEFGLRSGTVAVPMAVTLAKAARLAVETSEERLVNYRKWNEKLRNLMAGYLKDVHVLSTEQCAPYIFSFGVKGLKGEILINALQKRGVIVSTSSACFSKAKKTSHVVKALNVPVPFESGVLRVSMGTLTTAADIDAFCKAFKEVMTELKGE